MHLFGNYDCDALVITHLALPRSDDRELCPVSHRIIITCDDYIIILSLCQEVIAASLHYNIVVESYSLIAWAMKNRTKIEAHRARGVPCTPNSLKFSQMCLSTAWRWSRPAEHCCAFFVVGVSRNSTCLTRTGLRVMITWQIYQHYNVMRFATSCWPLTREKRRR